METRYNGGPIRGDIDRTELTHVHVNEGVTSIPDYTFRDWSSLKSVFISDGVTSIGRGAFFGCTILTTIRILCIWS